MFSKGKTYVFHKKKTWKYKKIKKKKNLRKRKKEKKKEKRKKENRKRKKDKKRKRRKNQISDSMFSKGKTCVFLERDNWKYKKWKNNKEDEKSNLRSNVF